MYADVGAPPTGGNKQQGKLLPPEIKWEHHNIHGKESVLNLAAARVTYGTGDGSTIMISCSEATNIKVWHGKTGKELGTLDTNQLKNNMTDISPNSHFIAAAAFTADVKSAATCLCFTPNSEQIITASKDGSIRVSNINGDITGIAWAQRKIPNGGVPAFVLATAGADKKVKLRLAPEVSSTWGIDRILGILYKDSFPEDTRKKKRGEIQV